jgi:AmiR/NasT family two-component response regulator
MEKRIVIADDEPITRMDIKDLLEEAGYKVVGEASDGFDAIEICKKERPDLVIMDIKMPNLNGLKASTIINKERLAKGIVLLTAFSDSESIEKAKSSGALGYLVKPLDEKSFIPTIEMVMTKGSEINTLKNELDKVNKKLEDRKLIEKAKGVIIKEENITENEAYSKIRKLSMDKRCSMREICEAILATDYV